MCDKQIKYTNSFARYVEPQNIESNCNAIYFYNKGTSVLIVNDMPIDPGAGFGISGNRCELDVSSYKISFSGVGTKNCFVIRKNYQ